MKTAGYVITVLDFISPGHLDNYPVMEFCYSFSYAMKIFDKVFATTEEASKTAESVDLLFKLWEVKDMNIFDDIKLKRESHLSAEAYDVLLRDCRVVTQKTLVI